MKKYIYTKYIYTKYILDVNQDICCLLGDHKTVLSLDV